MVRNISSSQWSARAFILAHSTCIANKWNMSVSITHSQVPGTVQQYMPNHMVLCPCLHLLYSDQEVTVLTVVYLISCHHITLPTSHLRHQPYPWQLLSIFSCHSTLLLLWILFLMSWQLQVFRVVKFLKALCPVTIRIKDRKSCEGRTVALSTSLGLVVKSIYEALSCLTESLTGWVLAAFEDKDWWSDTKLPAQFI